MARRITQFHFKGPKNLDLTGIEGFGDAISDIRKGARRQRALETLAQLGIEAARRERQLEDARNFERRRVAFAQRETERLDKDEALSANTRQPDFDQPQHDGALDDPILDEARAAIRLGASRGAVMQRLRQMGIDPERLR